MNSVKTIWCGLALIGILLYACDEDDAPIDEPESKDTEIYQTLSEYGFFVGDLINLTPADRLLPYDLNTPLFSDYALKPRFIYMPEGKTATYKIGQPLDFPTGAILIKNFLYHDDFRDLHSPKRVLETRLLIKQAYGWETATYIWDDNQQEARLSVVGKTIPVGWIDEEGIGQSTNYIVPNKNDCKGCHNVGNELIPLGPKARNLNKRFTYSNATMNQLDKWSQEGFLTGSPGSATAPAVPDWFDTTSGTLEERARAYLDVNCAHCHNPNGPANNSGLSLGWDEQNPTALGVCKPPIAAGSGSGGLQFGIVPGKPEESIMVYRMSSLEIDEAMPELGKTLLHDEGIQLISDWISAMPGDCN